MILCDDLEWRTSLFTKIHPVAQEKEEKTVYRSLRRLRFLLRYLSKLAAFKCLNCIELENNKEADSTHMILGDEKRFEQLIVSFPLWIVGHIFSVSKIPNVEIFR